VKVGSITKKQLEGLAKLKIQDMNCGSIETAMKTIAGTARSMGIDIKA
jgi:large subunit ribosomal protein L11